MQPEEYKIIKLKFKPIGHHSIGVSELLFTLRIFGYNNNCQHHLLQHVWQSLQKLDSLSFHSPSIPIILVYTDCPYLCLLHNVIYMCRKLRVKFIHLKSYINVICYYTLHRKRNLQKSAYFCLRTKNKDCV